MTGNVQASHTMLFRTNNADRGLWSFMHLRHAIPQNRSLHRLNRRQAHRLNRRQARRLNFTQQT